MKYFYEVRISDITSPHGMTCSHEHEMICDAYACQQKWQTVGQKYGIYGYMIVQRRKK